MRSRRDAGAVKRACACRRRRVGVATGWCEQRREAGADAEQQQAGRAGHRAARGKVDEGGKPGPEIKLMEGRESLEPEAAPAGGGRG